MQHTFQPDEKLRYELTPSERELLVPNSYRLVLSLQDRAGMWLPLIGGGDCSITVLGGRT